MGIVSGGRKANGHAASLMVSGDENEAFARMHRREVQRNLHRVRQGDGVVDGGRRVVGVACPVNLAALAHHEEAIVVIQHIDAAADKIRQREHVLARRFLLDAVDFVVNRLGVLKHRVGRQHAVVRRGQAADFVIRRRNHPAIFLCDVQQGFLLTIRAVHLLEAAACEVIHGRAGQRLKGNVIVVVAGGLLGVVRRRGRMIDRHGGDYADLLARFLGVFRDDLVGVGQRFIIIDDPGERLLAGSHRRSGRSGVRAEGRAVVGGHQTEVLELGEGQIRRNRELAVRVFDAAQIVLGCSHLRVAHAVADEHEHILRMAFAFALRHGRCAHQAQRQRAEDCKELLHDCFSSSFFVLFF